MNRIELINRELAQKANALRRQMGLSTTTPLSFDYVFQVLDINGLFCPMSESVSGMALKQTSGDGVLKLMLVNSALNTGRVNFTICHELYHLCIQEDFSFSVCEVGKFNTRDIHEYRADVFAAHLLMPEDAIVEFFQSNGPITVASLLHFESIYKCSRTALLYRLMNLGYLPKGEDAPFKDNIASLAYRTGYNVDLYIKPVNPRVSLVGDYLELANSLRETGDISEGHYIELLTSVGLTLDDYIVENE